MGYDAREESRRLIERGAPRDGPAHLTRRRRFVPLAVDVDGDVAATLFARRGRSGLVHLETWTFELVDGEWQLLGGGGVAPGPDLAAPRPTIDELGTPARVVLRGSTRRSAGSVGDAVVAAAADVGVLQVRDRRVVVPRHGFAIVVWASRRSQLVVALGDDGRPLGRISLTG